MDTSDTAPLVAGTCCGSPKKLLLIGLGPAGLASCRGFSKGTHVTVVEPKDFVEYTPSILNGIVNPDMWQQMLISTEDALRAACGRRATWTWERGYVSVVRHGSADITHRDGRTSVIEFDGAIIATGTSNGLWKAGGSPLVGGGAMALDAIGCTVMGREAQLRAEKARLESAALTAKSLANYLPTVESFAGAKPSRRPDAPVIVVVGGGIVGVELAGEIVTAFPDLQSYVTLVNRGERILKNGPASASTVAADWLASHGVNILTGDAGNRFLHELPPNEQPHVIKYVCTGGRPTLPKFEPPVLLDSKGYVMCDTEFRVLLAGSDISESCPWGQGQVFACGDCAEIRGFEGQFNKTIYPAETNAAKVAHNAEKVAFGCHWRLKYARKGLDPTVTSLGPSNAVMVVNGLTTMKGMPASLVKHAIEASKVDETRGGLGGKALWKIVPHF